MSITSPRLFYSVYKPKPLTCEHHTRSEVSGIYAIMKSTVTSILLALTGLMTLVIESTLGYSREVTLDQWEPWSPTCRGADDDISTISCPQLSVTLPLMDQDVEMKICDWAAIRKNTLSVKLATQCTQLFLYLGSTKVYIGCAPTKRPRGRLLQTIKPPEIVD